MKWIDVTLPLRPEQPAWPGDPPFVYRETETIRGGGSSNCAEMSLSVHFGTHLDAPYHFVEEGATIDEIGPDLFVGPCLIVEVPEAEKLVEPEHLRRKVPRGTKRLLVRTRNSAFIRDTVFHTDYTAFSEDCARFLVSVGVRFLGVDYFSIAPWEDPVPTHTVFLGSGGVALEGADLSGVVPGAYELLCLPLKIAGSGGAPARVFLGTE